MGWFDDQVEDVVEDLTELLVKTVLAGLTLTLSAPTIATATIFNNQIGYVDPLLYPPTPTGADHPLPHPVPNRVDAGTDRPTVFDFGIDSELGGFSRYGLIMGVVHSGDGHPA